MDCSHPRVWPNSEVCNTQIESIHSIERVANDARVLSFLIVVIEKEAFCFLYLLISFSVSFGLIFYLGILGRIVAEPQDCSAHN